MSAKRKLYWVTPSVLKEHELRAQALAAHNFDVRFFSTPEELRACIHLDRAGMVFISDSGELQEAFKRLDGVLDIPEIRGVRLFLSVERHHGEVLARAAASNFRDLIPLALEQPQWMKRLEYAAAGKPIVIQPPGGQVTMSNISAVYIPGRLVWLSGERMRIETSATPKVGSILNITGGLAQQLGLRSVTFHVDKIERSHLRYRFSDAMVGHWSVPREARDKARAHIESLRGRSATRTCRVLLAARSTSLRTKVFAELRPPLFEINAILKVQSLAQEPQYFSPDTLIIEDALCLGKMAETFAEMLTHVPKHTPIIVVGENEAAKELTRRHPEHNIILQGRLPANLLGSDLKTHFMPPSGEHNEDDGIPIAPQDDLSYIEVASPARLSCLHPTMIQVDLPHRVRQFALCRLSSPILGKVLGRDVWMKVTECFHNDQTSDDKFSTTAEAILSDVSKLDRQRMAKMTLKLISGHYKKLLQREDAVETFEQPADRTPELGSLVPQAITTSQEKPRPVPQAAPRLAPVAVSAVAVESRPRTKPAAADPAAARNAAKRAERIFVQAVWSILGVLFIWGVIWAVSQRDEEDTKASGKWFQEQLYKFAPNKFEK